MATTANPSLGAIPANGVNDPFSGTPHATSAAMRFAPFDTEHSSLYSTGSPSQAKRALEAHLKDTDRRIQDASRLGTTLVQQRKDLAARLKDVEQVQHDNEVPTDLRKKLADLEKEYNEIGKESARAFLPKTRVSSTGDVTGTPSAFTGSGRESPTKMTAPSRRQRNQPSNRVHDIEFATEISTSLLAQVRQLQAALAEKDDALRDITASKGQLEAETAGMVQRIKHQDENEQRYKDENWNLETRLQELESNFKTSSDKESRLAQSLTSTQSEKAAALRDLDDLKASHDKLSEEHAVAKKQQETDLNGLRRDAVSHETEKSTLQKKIDELTLQNTELARAVSSRWNLPSTATDADFVSADEDRHSDGGTPENSEPASPVKGTPRHGMLESETLKSSLNHAHRMIQNLKNNIHREKTEKVELKRMLQDARDELESRRSDSNPLSSKMAGKRRSDQDSAKFRKPARPDRLGANRSSTTEIMEDDQDWEDNDGASTPSKSRNVSAALGGVLVGAVGAAVAGNIPGAFVNTDNESTDADAAFETATEREGGTTDAFETSREDAGGDDSEELTETEDSIQRSGTIRGVAPLVGRKAGNRSSFLSTASTSAGEEEEEVQTPIQAQPKYRLRMNNRSSKRGRVDDLIEESPSQHSPASSSGTPQPAGQSLGDELDALDDGSMEGTPSRLTDSAAATPETQRQVSVEPETPGWDGDEEPQLSSPLPSTTRETDFARPVYADAGVMTEPWEPETNSKQGIVGRAGEVVGGTLAGFGLGRFAGGNDEQADSGALEKPVSESEERPRTALGDYTETPATSEQVKDAAPVQLQHSGILAQETEPVEPPTPVSVSRDLEHPSVPVAVAGPLAAEAESKQEEAFDFAPVMAQELEPREAPMSNAAVPPVLPMRSPNRSNITSTENKDYFASDDSIPGTDSARVGAGFFAAQTTADGSNDLPVEPKTYVPAGSRAPLGELPLNTVHSKPPMADEGSQTIVSGSDIENMLKSSNGKAAMAGAGVGALAGAAAGAIMMDSSTSPGRPQTARRSVDGALPQVDPGAARLPRRPASSGSMRNKGSGVPPPLPEDFNQKIAAVQKTPGTPGTATVGTMGPPLMPASAYKQNRPRTPAEGSRTLSRDGTTPRPPRAGSSHVQSPSGVSRRTSVSSFASELDERFNMQRGQLMYPEGVQPATDPRMIQAITQTMIGEYLWKYTRKAGRSETSNTRHRRFFWVHPYTRTLYWSEKDPSTAGRDMLKAKSVAIDAVRVITDDNAYPPGLHRKSLVVVTPGREIVFTAPTGQRHETWFNALSYLLLRTEQEKGEAGDTIDQEDLDEFNPGVGSSIRRSISRMAGRSQSRVSLSSYNSRTTRASGGSLAQRQSAAAARGKEPMSPSPNPAGTSTSRYSTVRDSNAGRLSSLTSKFRTSGAPRGSFSSARGRSSTMNSRGRGGGSEIYDASVAADSAEDVRAQIQRQEEEADRLENVRACCDGKQTSVFVM